MMKRRILVTVVLLGVFFAKSVIASELHPQRSKDTTIRINEVVVSATRAEVNRNNVPMSISVIRRSDIEQSGESALLPLLSQRVPGLFVTQRGVTGFGISEGAAGTVNIRGVGQGNKVLMLYDGQPQWAGLFGHHLPDTYVASDIEKVEVVRGPASLIYGSNAMAGAVNIMTRQQQEDGSTTQVNIMYGSYNTQKYMINNGYKKGRLSTFVSVNHDHTDGHRENSGFSITNGFAKVGYQISSHFKTTVDVSLSKINSQNPGMITKPIFDNKIDVLRGTATAALENKFDKSSGAIRFFYNFGRHEINDGYFTGEKPKKYLFNSQDHNYGVLAYQSFYLLRGNSFTVGIDYKNWGGHGWNDMIEGGTTELADRDIHETAAYAIMQQTVARKVNLTAGVRYEYNSTFSGAIVPHGGVTYSPFTDTHIKASISKGFRSPNIRELYMFMPANPNLKPESMITYEASVGQRMLSGKLFAELTAYVINAKDMIQVVFVDGRPKNINTGKFKNKGIEFEVNYHLIPGLTLLGNWSYLHLEKPIIAAPEHQGFIGATYNFRRFTFSLNSQYIGGLYTSVDSKSREYYTLLNGQISYVLGGNLRERFTIFAKVDNITATKYTINYGFPMPGAVAMGGIKIKF